MKKHAKLKLICTVWGMAEAEVIRSLLQSYGIKCLLRSHVVQSVHPFSMNGLGELKVFVNEEDYNKAKKIISEHSLNKNSK
ncbi:DUF2007 domain-containing protein [Candidatus Aminicenantes bacterium AH-873-B07]|jgi:hypothetical protein|nr:DUF2007 domain-containing protein [Candidatus Aminicenantes bacterium AH-873-B07]